MSIVYILSYDKINGVIYILNLILGRSGSGKTHYIREILKKQFKLMNKKVIFLVPEQNSFETEKSILSLIGEKNFKYIEVLSFSRFNEFISRTVGKRQGERLSDGGRNVFMSMAIEEAKSDLKLYSKSSDDIEMINMFIETLKEIKTCSIPYEALRKACNDLQDGTLKQKLSEILKIINFYDRLISKNFCDPLDDLSCISNVLKSTILFSEYTVFVDSYSNFTLQQLNLLEEIIAQAKDTFITFCTDGTNKTQETDDLFYTVDKTIEKILSDVRVKGVEIAKPVVLNPGTRFKNNELKELERNFFITTKKHFEKSPKFIHIYNASDVYDECEFIARTIRKTVIEKGYRYNNFAIIAREIKNYGETLGNILSRYDVPYFIDEPEELIDKTLLCTVFSAFETVISNFGHQDIFRYLKTGLAGINTDEISILENYVLLWEISGDNWLSEFTMHPDGFSKTMKETDRNTLLEINKIRKAVLKPLLNFKKRISGKTGYEISKAVYKFLVEINMSENIREFCDRLINSGDIGAAEEQSRLWDMLMNALDQMAMTLKDTKVSPKKYMGLLKLVIQSEDISFIPQGLDEVVVGSVDRIRLSGAKMVFIIGASNGEFPRTPISSGVFNDRERKKLISMGLDMYDVFDKLIMKERFLAYIAVSMPSECLYISWPSSSISSEAKFPSEMVREIQSIFPNISVIDKYLIGIEDWIWAEKPSFDICTREWNKDSKLTSSLKEYFLSKENYKDKIISLRRAINKGTINLLDSEKAKNLFGSNIRLSSSQMDKFYLCKFQYFCKYGLRAEERKLAKFNSLEYGSLVHFVLEHVFKNYKGNNLNNINQDEIKIAVQNFMNIYVEKFLEGWENKSPRFKYLFSRCSSSIEFLLKKLLEEFKQSRFKPVDYELDISRGGDIKPVLRKLPDGGYVEVNGKIDRVDIMELNSKRYVRIVDYKTGSKSFKLSDLLIGMNMQMVLYLIAVVENGNERYGEITPAGILYMPAGRPSVIIESDKDQDNMNYSKIYRKTRMSGIILDEEVIIESMEEKKRGLFIPISIKNGKLNGKESLISSEKIKLIMKYVEKMVIDMASDLRKGDISINPISWENGDSCQWCSYKPVCGFEGDKFREIISKIDKDKSIEEMQKEIAKEAIEKEIGGENFDQKNMD